MKGNQIGNSQILVNVSSNMMNRLISYIISFFIILYTTRVLQPQGYGKVSFAASFVGYFVLIANLGMPIYSMRLCAEHKDDVCV